jgi:glycosyltransferase involved in cell wall biosynthesis
MFRGNPKPLRIGFLVSRYPTIPHTFILREILHLRAKGDFEVFTASLNQPDRPTERLTEEEWHEVKKTVYIKSKGVLGSLAGAAYFLTLSPLRFFQAFFFSLSLGKTDITRILFSFFHFGEALVLGRWMRQRKIHHLHVHFATPASTVAMIASRLTGKSFSMTIHGQDEFYDMTLNLLKEKINHADFICCVGYYPMSQLMRITSPTLWHKFSLTRVGIDPSLYVPGKPRENKILRIISVGRLVSAKGQYILIEALAKLLNENYSLELVLVGDGPERHLLEQLTVTLKVEDRVMFTGGITEAEVLQQLSRADIFVLPTVSEGISVAIMEAMAMEVPVISCAVSAVPELIQNYHDGILVPPGDLEALCAAMRLLIENVEWRIAFGAAGREKIQTKFNLSTNVEVFGEILKSRLAPK